jgi:RNA polymerase sigma factor (sigma-70 family)
MKETQACTQTEPMPSFCKGDNVYEEMNKALRRCRASFIRNAYRFLNNEADAEDAVQDALLSAYKHIDQFRGEAQMSTWLNAIVSNSARMQLRKRQRQTLVSLDEPIGEEEEQTASDSLTDCRPDPEDEYRESELHAHAEGHVAQLSPPLRKAFELRVLDGLTANEAARTAGMAERTPKFRASYEAAQTTERFPRQATTTGLPRSRGSSRCSTDAWYKNSGWSGAQRSFKKGVCI